MENKSFKHWCIVELFGHAKIAGLCTEENIAGTNMLRVDVPETKQQPAFTRYFGSGAIYAINPVDEQTCAVIAESLNVAPVAIWQAESFIEKVNQNKALPPADEVQDAVFEDDEDPLYYR